MQRQIQDAYVIAAIRTPVGKAPRGVFRHTRPDSMLAHVLRAVLARAPAIAASEIEDVIVGCAMPEFEQGMNVARIGLLLAGLPDAVPGMTVNRFCSSGLNAVSIAADRIRTGEADVVIAAGTESMSMIPMLGRLAMNAEVFARDENLGIAYGMGLTAEKVAQRWGVTREAQDAFAVSSHRKAVAAQADGAFADEIVPYPVCDDVPDLPAGEIAHRARTIERDEGPRPDTTAEGLARLRPVFAAKGSVTAGNSSQMSDGAGASILVSERIVRERGLAPLARWVGYAVGGVPPEIMGVGPIVAIPKLLRHDGRRQGGHRLDRAQRGLRGTEPRRDARARPRPREGESAGRSHRPRSSTGRHRRDPHGDHRARHAPAQAEIWLGDDVRRHRHGRGRPLRRRIASQIRAMLRCASLAILMYPQVHSGRSLRCASPRTRNLNLFVTVPQPPLVL